MKNVMFVYGCGGHKNQADRLSVKLSSSDDKIYFFSITDVGLKPIWSDDHLELCEFRDKRTGKIISLLEMIKQMSKTYFFIKKNNVSNVISMGPGVCIPVCIVSKFVGCVVIHFETWSKFESVTFTTRVIKYFTKNIFYQNVELEKFLPNGKYVGRL
jgi:beta-1,4-N-acetylglucosaminyltransferase